MVMQAVGYPLNRPTPLLSSYSYDPAAPVTSKLQCSGADGGHIAQQSDEAQLKIAA